MLWLLRSGVEMEMNIRRLVRNEYGTNVEQECLIFANVVERTEHLRRLGIADVFLDTPVYNAHTLVCDALYMGVPMLSLLRNVSDVSITRLDSKHRADVDLGASISIGPSRDTQSITTNKLASRVGASLLLAVGLDDLVYETMTQYEEVMFRCASDKEWFSKVRQRLLLSIDTSPLFDTSCWVRSLEAAFSRMAELDLDCNNYPDIIVTR